MADDPGPPEDGNIDMDLSDNDSFLEAEFSEPEVEDLYDDIAEDNDLGYVDDEIAAIEDNNELADIEDIEDDNDMENNLPGNNDLDPSFFSVDQRGPGHVEDEEDITILDHFVIAVTQNLINKETYNSLMERMYWLKKAKRNHPWIPTDMETFWRRIGRNNDGITYRLQCEDCSDIVGESTTPSRNCRCGKCGPGKSGPLATYVYISVEKQLKELFRKAGIATDLRYRFTRTKTREDAFEDIYDGEAYRELSAEGQFLHVQAPNDLESDINFSFTLWVDHVQLTKSSTARACPILLLINELSPFARKRHMVLAGLWTGNSKPPRHTLLQPVITEMRSLHEEGIVNLKFFSLEEIL